MKSRTIFSLSLVFLLISVQAFSQTVIPKKQTEKEIKEFFDVSANYNRYIDSVRPAIRLAREAMSDVTWAQGRNNYFQLLDNSRNSSLSFRKEFREKKNFQRSYEMDFDKEQKALDIRIEAEAREGRIQIIIVKPDGKNFKTMVVEDMESLSWNHTINAYTEEKSNNYAGLWQVKVVVENAIGEYNVRLTVR